MIALVKAQRSGLIKVLAPAMLVRGCAGAGEVLGCQPQLSRKVVILLVFYIVAFVVFEIA